MTTRTETDPIAVLLAGTTDAILCRLEGTRPGATVLDLACGTGEPAATILARHPSWRLIGIDHSEQVLAAARERVSDPRAEFRVGSMSAVDLSDGSVDAVVSRMGALMMGDTAATAREIARVVRPGGRISIAAWAEQEHNPFLALAVDALRDVGAPERLVPDRAEWFDAMAVPGVRDGWLREAGVAEAGTERVVWSATFGSFEAWWDYQAVGGPLTAALTEFDDSRIRAAMGERMAAHRAPDGTYTIPALAQLVWGVR